MFYLARRKHLCLWHCTAIKIAMALNDQNVKTGVVFQPVTSWLTRVNLFFLHKRENVHLMFPRNWRDGSIDYIYNRELVPFWPYFSLSIKKFKVLVKGPRTLQLKLQEKQLSSIHTTTFFHNCNEFFRKIFVKIFVVCEGLNSLTHYN